MLVFHLTKTERNLADKSPFQFGSKENSNSN